LPEDMRYYCASDHAVGTKERNDPSVLLKVGVDADDNIYIIDCIWKRMPTDEAVEAMLEMGSGSKRPDPVVGRARAHLEVDRAVFAQAHA
jgi:hypothetical protein